MKGFLKSTKTTTNKKGVLSSIMNKAKSSTKKKHVRFTLRKKTMVFDAKQPPAKIKK